MRNLTNKVLIENLKNLVGEERKLATKILEYLREVETRKLFLELGYPSLFEFCMKELGYSEGSAQRRISAMRLVKDIPEIEAKIVSGELSLSVAAQAQSFFKRQEKKDLALQKSEKLGLLKNLERTSSRQCESILIKLDPEIVRKDKVRQITSELSEVRLTVNHEFTDKIEKLKNLLSHGKPDISTKEIIEMALDAFLLKKDLLLKQARTPSPPTSAVKSPELAKPKTRYIPATIKRAVWQKSNSRCSYVNPATGQICGSKRFLEIDHIKAQALGGETTLENLQLLCDSHNRWKGIKEI